MKSCSLQYLGGGEAVAKPVLSNMYDSGIRIHLKVY